MLKIYIDNIQYSINSEDKLTLGEWVDIEEVLKGGNNRLASILAIVLRPTNEVYNSKNLSDRINLFNKMTMDELFPLFSFFLTLNEKYKMIMKVSLMAEEAVNQLHQHTEVSLKNGAGIIKSQNLQMMIYNKWTRFYKWVLSKYSTSSAIR